MIVLLANHQSSVLDTFYIFKRIHDIQRNLVHFNLRLLKYIS